VNSGRVSDEDLCCPLPACRRKFEPEVLAGLLGGSEEREQLHARLLDFQASRFLPEPGDGERFVTCPTANCGKLLVPVEIALACEAITCPICAAPFCAGCCQSSHAGMSCEAAELQRMDPQFRKLLEKENWVRCPSCRNLCERESGCNFMTCPSEQCQSKTHFCYLCGEILAASDHAAHYEGFEGAIGRVGPFGSVCANKRTLDTSLPERPPAPRLGVVLGEEEGSIALRLTFGAHRSEPPTMYYRVQLEVPGTDEQKKFTAGVHDPHVDLKPGRLVQKYRRYQAAVTPVNVNGPGPTSEHSDVVHFHPRELESEGGRSQQPPPSGSGGGGGASAQKTKRWAVAR